MYIYTDLGVVLENKTNKQKNQFFTNKRVMLD